MTVVLFLLGSVFDVPGRVIGIIGGLLIDQVIILWFWGKIIDSFYAGKGIYFGLTGLLSWVYRYLLLSFGEPHGISEVEHMHELTKLKKKLFFLSLFPLMLQKLSHASQQLIATKNGDDAILTPVKNLPEKQKIVFFDQILNLSLDHAKDDFILVFKRLEYLAQGIALLPRSYKQSLEMLTTDQEKKKAAKEIPWQLLEKSVDSYAETWFNSIREI